MMSDVRTIPKTLRACYLAMHRQTNARLAPLGITADQFVCLAILAQTDGMIQRDLVQRATSDQNTVSAMLLLLERKRYVTRRAHADDRRARLVRLTAKGRAVVARSHAALKPVHHTIESVLSASETRALETALARLAEALR